jgi:hypothetical protein
MSRRALKRQEDERMQVSGPTAEPLPTFLRRFRRAPVPSRDLASAFAAKGFLRTADAKNRSGYP